MSAGHSPLVRPPPVLAVRDGAVVRRLRGFPMFDEHEAARALGFVRLSRVVATVPMTTLGVLSVLASLAAGLPLVAVIAGMFTVLLVLALWQDTRLTKALGRLHRGELAEARRALLPIAVGGTPVPQRQRARAYLAAIGWVRGDHAEALRWTQRRLRGMRSHRTPTDERFFTEATRIQLLALTGAAAEARAALEQMTHAPASDDCRAFEQLTRLLVAYTSDDVELVRVHLDEWEAVLWRDDRAGFGLALLVWAYDAAGRPDAADLLRQRLGEDGRLDRPELERHVPGLADVVDGRRTGRRYR